MKFGGVIILAYLLCKCFAPISAQEIGSGKEYYLEAKGIIEAQESIYKIGKPVFNNDNIDNNVYIPQYDSETKDYEYPKDYQNVTFPEIYDKAMPLLEKAADLGNSDALVDLADLYMFGNFSVKTNYTKAVELYHRAVKIKGNGHAYFMLGHSYATGLFGEIPVDQAKATLYYQFGMENGDINSILALANRHYRGISTSVSHDLALLYYSNLAHIGMNYLESNNISEDKDISYNLRLMDFNNGLYGDKVSETHTSVSSNSRFYKSTKDNLLDFMDDYENPYMDYYFLALEAYEGDYFYERNYTKAFENAYTCVLIGEKEFGDSYSAVPKYDRFFLSRCQALVGRMYLKGYGVQQDDEIAYNWLNTSIKLENISDALRDIGSLYEHGFGKEKANLQTATNYYTRALGVEYPSSDANINLAKLLIRESKTHDLALSDYRKEIHKYVTQAIQAGNRESYYLYAELLQSGFIKELEPEKIYTNEKAIIYLKAFVERTESFLLPHLKYAFEEFRFGRFKNSLLGYLIAAEQGLERAQMSASYILYQLQPLLKKQKAKTFEDQRIISAITYLERASAQRNKDATILLGDIYLNGIEGSNVTIDTNKAFSYYSAGALDRSAHACYNLAYMYEYGLVPINNSVDFFMAKRYYDLSLKYKTEEEIDKKQPINKLYISLALLRLRFKYLFLNKSSTLGDDSTGWFNAIKNIARNNEPTFEEDNKRAQEHHEGYEEAYYEDDEDIVINYLLIFCSFIFFCVFIFQNIIRPTLRPRNNGNNQEQNDAGFNNIQFRRGNFEFHFFAI